MGSKVHHLKPYGAGLGKVTSGGKMKKQENVIDRDMNSGQSSQPQYNKNGM